MTNALTFDVEDYFQVSAFESVIDRVTWNNLESRVEVNTERIMTLLAEKEIKATFFVLGWIAKRYPGIVKSIVEQGHELACHGYSHKLIYNQTQEEFRDETARSKDLLESIANTPVRGYRAASYSITKRSLWALDTLIELGFEYDSSIYPVLHDRYGIDGAPRFPHMIARSGTGSLLEFPVSTLSILGRNLPVGGGGYFRLYPYRVTKAALTAINRRDKMPFIFYLHPWEMDPDQPRIKGSVFSKFRHYNNLSICEERLKMLVSDFSFTTVQKVLENIEIPLQEVVY
ncbi:MAG: DUF3473 domain-containing protein [Gammaproteobacteria bacterium]|nr:DUF3473 domain-containing protein [Gammaproteobacteria bacterium]